ncbi:iron chelate uptake ABC transporter family permease subunit [Anaerosinus massiliensis]|uniref:iron chelate uptake ABC transporter family permease subunit n=1 Tax=Massilibacillus massiliensis TaxID=1806837 RepID=UPI000A8F2302|nr:iron chelate uptake ABC transporter family permease subunit [Massilibacillus massiliensis]
MELCKGRMSEGHLDVTKTDKRAMKILIVLAIFALCAVAFFLFQGLNAGNFDFNFPRRLRKIAAMALVSVCVGYSSVVFQTITENKILTPSVMGLDSLYVFIQSCIVFLFGAKKLVLLDNSLQFILSVVAMMIASLIIYKIVFKEESRNVYTLVLVGMIMGTFFSGIASFLQLMIDPNEFAILQGKLFANFKNVDENLLVISFVIVAMLFIISRKDISAFDVLGLGRETGISLGIDYHRFVRRTMLIIAAMVSVSTVLVGPITFLGILLVSLSRELLKTYRHCYIILGAVLMGVIALPVGQVMVEHVFNGKTTLSVILNFIGGIYFVFILLKESKND